MYTIKNKHWLVHSKKHLGCSIKLSSFSKTPSCPHSQVRGLTVSAEKTAACLFKVALKHVNAGVPPGGNILN